MNDTPPAVDAMYRELLMKKSAAERLCMAASMHDAAPLSALGFPLTVVEPRWTCASSSFGASIARISVLKR
ncbi:MAG: hypothetical protein IPH86_17415 [bacterium]|nr:hypothetical protein [bacterium]